MAALESKTLSATELYELAKFGNRRCILDYIKLVVYGQNLNVYHLELAFELIKEYSNEMSGKNGLFGRMVDQLTVNLMKYIDDRIQKNKDRDVWMYFNSLLEEKVMSRIWLLKHLKKATEMGNNMVLNKVGEDDILSTICEKVVEGGTLINQNKLIEAYTRIKDSHLIALKHDIDFKIDYLAEILSHDRKMNKNSLNFVHHIKKLYTTGDSPDFILNKHYNLLFVLGEVDVEVLNKLIGDFNSIKYYTQYNMYYMGRLMSNEVVNYSSSIKDEFDDIRKIPEPIIRDRILREGNQLFKRYLRNVEIVISKDQAERIVEYKDLLIQSKEKFLEGYRLHDYRVYPHLMKIYSYLGWGIKDAEIIKNIILEMDLYEIYDTPEIKKLIHKMIKKRIRISMNNNNIIDKLIPLSNIPIDIKLSIFLFF